MNEPNTLPWIYLMATKMAKFIPANNENIFLKEQIKKR